MVRLDGCEERHVDALAAAMEQAKSMMIPAAGETGSEASTVVDEADMQEFDELVRIVLFAPRLVRTTEDRAQLVAARAKAAPTQLGGAPQLGSIKDEDVSRFSTTRRLTTFPPWASSALRMSGRLSGPIVLG